MKHWLSVLEDTLWPRGLKCLCCDDLSEGALLCSSCELALNAMRLSASDAGDDYVRSIYRYDGMAKQLVLSLKMNCTADAASALAVGMADAAVNMKLPADTVLTWVTMPEVRRRVRGIDHGRILCEAVAARIGLPVRQMLVRTRMVHTQRGLRREERLRNLSGTIKCIGHIDTPVLLIDDVLTTGATVSACADILLKAGAPRVYAMTATKVLLHPND